MQRLVKCWELSVSVVGGRIVPVTYVVAQMLSAYMMLIILLDGFKGGCTSAIIATQCIFSTIILCVVIACRKIMHSLWTILSWSCIIAWCINCGLSLIAFDAPDHMPNRELFRNRRVLENARKLQAEICPAATNPIMAENQKTTNTVQDNH